MARVLLLIAALAFVSVATSARFNRFVTTDGLKYTLGARVAGDRIVAHKNDADRSNSIENMKWTIKYPVIDGQTSTLTYVEVIVKQDGTSGDATILSGGVNQKDLSFTIESKNTRYSEYSVAFYGKN